MYISQVDSSPGRSTARLILEHHLHLEVRFPFFRNDRVSIEYRGMLLITYKVILQALVDCQVRCNDNKMLCQLGASLAQAMEITPGDCQAHHFRLPAAGSHLTAILGPAVFIGVNA